MTTQFQSTLNQGFKLRFENGYVISVQFGPGNYGYRGDADSRAPQRNDFWANPLAEVQITDPQGEPTAEFFDNGGSSLVEGWLTTNEVASYIARVSAK